MSEDMSPYCSAHDEWLIMKLCMYVGYHPRCQQSLTEQFRFACTILLLCIYLKALHVRVKRHNQTQYKSWIHDVCLSVGVSPDMPRFEDIKRLDYCVWLKSSSRHRRNTHDTP